MLSYNLSQATLNRIIKVFETREHIESDIYSNWGSKVVDSRLINSTLNSYITKTKTPFTTKLVRQHIKNELGVMLSMELTRRMMKKHHHLVYKRGVSRSINLNRDKLKLSKYLYFVHFWKLLKWCEVLVNIDEWSISRHTKNQYSWF